MLFVVPIYADKNVPVYRCSTNSENKIALTFDDGPHPKITHDILDVLKKHGIKATFFVIGENIDHYEGALKRAINEGHEIGNHTNSHAILSSIDKEKIEYEIKECERKIKDKTGYESKLIRPPCGLYDDKLLKLAISNDYKIILWNVDTHDWAHKSSQCIIETVDKNVKGGDIILFHDYISGKNNNIVALEKLIPMLKRCGYEFVTVSELIENEGK